MTTVDDLSFVTEASPQSSLCDSVCIARVPENISVQNTDRYIERRAKYYKCCVRVYVLSAFMVILKIICDNNIETKND